MQVERSYDCVSRCDRRDINTEAKLGFELGAWANKTLRMNLSPEAIRDASNTTPGNIALESGVMLLSSVFFASVSTSFLSAFPHNYTPAVIIRCPSRWVC